MQLMLNYKKNSFPVSASFSEIQSNSSAALKWFVLPVSPLVDGLTGVDGLLRVMREICSCWYVVIISLAGALSYFLYPFTIYT